MSITSKIIHLHLIKELKILTELKPTTNKIIV